jgi:hypothetical protein
MMPFRPSGAHRDGAPMTDASRSSHARFGFQAIGSAHRNAKIESGINCTIPDCADNFSGILYPRLSVIHSICIGSR